MRGMGVRSSNCQIIMLSSHDTELSVPEPGQNYIVTVKPSKFYFCFSFVVNLLRDKSNFADLIIMNSTQLIYAIL